MSGGWGSPPRGRGRLSLSTSPRAREGLTPAWAGTAPRPPPAGCPWGAHPRVGGDGPCEQHGEDGEQGSPPRGRGRLLKRRHASGDVGLTPAWAGTAAGSGCRPGRPRAHPRVGGDGGERVGGFESFQGSPPRGRGRPGRFAAIPPTLGLTPAWAGTAAGPRRVPRGRRAHPRVGGDGRWQRGRGRDSEGSPPRGRGRLSLSTSPRAREGLTPAWAGTAVGGLTLAAWTRAHPRVGGDGRIT